MATRGVLFCRILYTVGDDPAKIKTLGDAWQAKFVRFLHESALSTPVFLLSATRAWSVSVFFLWMHMDAAVAAGWVSSLSFTLPRPAHLHSSSVSSGSDIGWPNSCVSF